MSKRVTSNSKRWRLREDKLLLTGKARNRTSSSPFEPLPLVRALFLALLKTHPNSTGYDLMRLAASLTKGLIELKSGTVYPELRRLEKLGLVSSHQESTQRKQRNYQITKAGIKALDQLVHQIQFRVKYVLEPLIVFAQSQQSVD